MRMLLGSLLVLVLLGGCGERPVALQPDGPAPTLPAGDFVATDLPSPYGPGDEVRVSFDDDGVSFRATCNTMSGTASVEGDVLRAGSVGGTEMGCPDGGDEQDEWLVDFFTAGPRITTLVEGFELEGGGTTLRFLPPGAAPADDDVALEGTRWRLTGIERTGDGTVSFTRVPRDARARVRIRGRELDLYDGCNWGGARVRVGERELRLGPVMTTLRGCLDGLFDVSRAQGRVLARGTTAWEVTGDELRLTRGRTTLLHTASS